MSSDVTVGFCAVILACGLSNNVSTYGFNFFRENDWSKKHYLKVLPHTNKDITLNMKLNILMN